jgi:hypothetical protein
MSHVIGIEIEDPRLGEGEQTIPLAPGLSREEQVERLFFGAHFPTRRGPVFIPRLFRGGIGAMPRFEMEGAIRRAIEFQMIQRLLGEEEEEEAVSVPVPMPGAELARGPKSTKGLSGLK